MLAKCNVQKSQDVYLKPTKAAGPPPADVSGALLYAAALLRGAAPPLSGYAY